MGKLTKLINEGRIKEMFTYLHNIELVTFTAIGRTVREDPKSTIKVQKVTIGINKDLDLHWQVESHLVSKYKFEYFEKITFHD